MIRLGQALKLANLAEDGHHAKTLVSEGRRCRSTVPWRPARGAAAPGDVLAVPGSGVRPSPSSHVRALRHPPPQWVRQSGANSRVTGVLSP
ncbi:RNA-binding S4 domain-containing protein [Kocuria rhizophila]|nr:RNA-binding S4 domain-containing protein [Kocuria rhizophila]